MINKIQILPETLANQIAAGEVIQRPASVVKELVENSIDAQATEITINIKDAGKTLIQIIDNGTGMSADDARLAFERHATSKIKTSEDLFNIHTKGFRGEALASIAAVAQVEVHTRQKEDEIGVLIVIEGNKLIKIESVSTNTGSNFLIKNLFFNIPARRKFLKADSTEFFNIINEIQRIALPHYNVAFTLIHNDEVVYKLPQQTLKERIISIFDSSIRKQLLDINIDAGFVKVYGYVGNPQFATKNNTKQFFFVNNRFFRSSYFGKAIQMAYDKLIAEGQKPNFFIFFEIDPQKIDVNIHPTKTEINFEDASHIFQLLITVIRKALTDFDITPAIDFDNTDFVNLSFDNNQNTKSQQSKDAQLLDFESTDREIFMHSHILSNYKQQNLQQRQENIFNQQPSQIVNNKQLIILKNRFLLTPVKSGLMIINFKRAYKQIKYEELINTITVEKVSIESLYPISIRLQYEEMKEFETIKEDFEQIGFKFEKVNDVTLNITAVPPYIKLDKVSEVIKNLIRVSMLTDVNVKSIEKEEIAREVLLSQNVEDISINSAVEGEELINKLFACKSHQYTFDGKLILSLIETEAIEKMFE